MRHYHRIIATAVTSMLAFGTAANAHASSPKHPVDSESVHYKPGTGLVIASKDGRFGNSLRLRAQFRYAIYADEGAALTHLMQIRRARIQWQGHTFGKSNKFKVEFAFSPRDLGYKNGKGISNTPVLSWFMDVGPSKNARIKFGQYKVPFNKQRVISSGDLQLVDRSLGNGEFNLDRDTGIEVHSDDLLGLGMLQYHVGVFMNRGRDLAVPVAPKVMLLARLEVLPFGLFDNFKEADLGRSNKPRLAIGAAFARLDDAVKDRGIKGSAPLDGGTTDFLLGTVDVMFKMSGFSLLSEVYWRRGERDPGDGGFGKGVPIKTSLPRNGMGWFAQAGYLFGRAPIELAARFGLVSGSSSGLAGRKEAGVGVSWYPGGHPWKVQADWFNEWGTSGFNNGDRRFRLQLQMAY